MFVFLCSCSYVFVFIRQSKAFNKSVTIIISAKYNLVIIINYFMLHLKTGVLIVARQIHVSGTCHQLLFRTCLYNS